MNTPHRFELLRVNTQKAAAYFDYSKKVNYVRSGMFKKNEIRDNKVKGMLSLKSIKSVNEIINNWISTIDVLCSLHQNKKPVYSKYLTFVTLTLSFTQFHSDEFIRRHMLNDFLRTIKTKFRVKNYLYVSEAQKNGNIHFHIVIDRRIHYLEIRKIWNRIQSTHNYIHLFKLKHGHANPNSTDIHGFRKVKRIAAYLVKYMTKKADRREIKGRLWGSSDNLKKLEAYRTSIDYDIGFLLNSLVDSVPAFVKKGQYFTMFNSLSLSIIKEKCFPLYVEICNHYSCFSYLL